MQLSLAAGTILDAQVVEMPRIAAAAGFPLLGVRLDPATADTRQAREIKRTAHDAGVTIFDLEVLRLLPADADDRSHFHLLDLAAELGARQVLAVTQEVERARIAERLRHVSEHAARLNLGVVLEFMRFTTVRTLADALDILHQVDHPALGVLVDLLHLARTNGTPDDVALIPPGRAPYVQICDAHSLTPLADESAYEYEARYDRAMPGQGALPLVDFIQACAARGDVAALSVEVQSTSLASQMDPFQRARLAFTTTSVVVEQAVGQAR